MALDIEKLKLEFQTFLDKDGIAALAEAAAKSSKVALDNVIDEESNAVAVRQAQADLKVSQYQSEYDLDKHEAADARALAEAQKNHLGGLLGLTPEVSDPTPDELEDIHTGA
jgi:hypothetical protein